MKKQQGRNSREKKPTGKRTTGASASNKRMAQNEKGHQVNPNLLVGQWVGMRLTAADLMDL